MRIRRISFFILLCCLCWNVFAAEYQIKGVVIDKSTRQPLVVPEKAMRDFIRISRTMDEDLVYLSEVAPKLREGQRVRVLAGPFQGVEGVVVRVRKSKRVMVELPGMMAVATTFIQPDLLETLPGFPSAD